MEQKPVKFGNTRTTLLWWTELTRIYLILHNIEDLNEYPGSSRARNRSKEASVTIRSEHDRDQAHVAQKSGMSDLRHRSASLISFEDADRDDVEVDWGEEMQISMPDSIFDSYESVQDSNLILFADEPLLQP